MLKETLQRVRERQEEVEYELSSDDNILAMYPKDVVMDLNDEFGEVISDYEVLLADQNHPSITLFYTSKGSKIKKDIEKNLRSLGYIK